MLAGACAPTAPANVGVATMAADGTITLMLRSEDHGRIAEAVLVKRPGDADYEQVKAHLGGLKPGESKAIPPWPEPPRGK
jgi:hypothetical protein